MVDEAGFVAVKHRVDTEREEFVVVSLLYLHLVRVTVLWVVHVKQVGQSILIVAGAPHIPLLLGHHFSFVLHDECTSRYFFKCKKPPHFDALCVLTTSWIFRRA